MNITIKKSENIFKEIGEDCCRKWFGDKNSGMVNFTLYPVLGIDLITLRGLIELDWPTQQDWKVKVASVDLNNLVVPDCTPGVKIYSQDTRVSIPSEIIRNASFQGPALLLSTPVDDRANTTLAIILPSLLRMHRGNAIAWGMPISFRFNGKTKDIWFPITTSNRYDQETHGPFDREDMNCQLDEVVQSIFSSSFPEDKKKRVVFALELFADASSSNSLPTRTTVFNYWSAIEYLCDTTETKALLKALFKNAPLNQPSSEFFFKKVRIQRHNIVHKGHSPQSSPYILERYLQVVFLDMLYSFLELPYQGYLNQFTNRHGTDWLAETYKS